MEPKKVIIKGRKPVQSTSQPAPQPADAVPKVQAPPNSAFLPSGNRVYMDSEKKTMEILGVEPGEPLPQDFKDVLNSELAEYQARIRQLETSGRSPLKERKVRLEDLPPEKQEKLKSLLEQLKSESPNAQTSQTDPGMAGLSPQFRDIVNNIKHIESPAFRGKVVGGKQPDKNEEPVAEKQPESEQKVKPAANSNQTGATTPPGNCPCCGWAYNKPIDEAPSEEDKANFLICLESGAKFKKEYKLFGNRVSIVFQNPKIRDYEVCLKAIDKKRLAGDVASIDHAAMLLADYRLSLSVSRLTTGNFSESFPGTLKGWEIEENDSRRTMTLDEIVEYLQEETPLREDSLWRAVGHAWQRFQSVSAVLELHATDPNFYSAVGTRS